LGKLPLLVCLLPLCTLADVPATAPVTSPVQSRSTEPVTPAPTVVGESAATPVTVLEEPSGAEIPRVRLLSCSDEGAAFEVSFPEAVLYEHVVEGEAYTGIHLAGTCTEDLPGSVGLPLFRARLWIPPGATPVPTATASSPYQRAVENPLPAPRWVVIGEGEITSVVPVYESDPKLSAVERPTVEPGETQTVRGWRLAHFLLRPVHYADGRLTGYRRVRVEVNFIYNTGRPSPNLDTQDSPWALDLARSLAPNFAYAREHGWRVGPPPPRSEQLHSGQLPLPRLKVAVEEDKLYTITPEDLSAAGLDPATVDPRRLTLYTSSGKMLDPDDTLDEDPLIRVPVLVTGEEDETFDSGDALYFWGRANVTWRPEEEWDPLLPSYKNLHSPYGYYWLVETDAPWRFDELDAAPDGETSLHYLQGRLHYEEDVNAQCFARLKNVVEGMDIYLWKQFNLPEGQPSSYDTLEYNIFDHERGGGDALLALRFKPAILDGPMTLRVYVGSTPGDPGDAVLTVTMDRIDELYEAWGTIPTEELEDGYNNLTFELVTTSRSLQTGARSIVIDAFDLIHTRGLRMQNGRLEGWGPTEVNGDRRFRIHDVTGDDVVIWDLTRGESLVNYELAGEEGARYLDFVWNAAPNYHLVAADLDKAESPLDVYLDVPSDLHSPVDADVIYISHPDFVTPLDPLVEMHRAEGMRVEVVRVDDIFDEYAGGRLDPAAIRDYLYHAYTDHLGDPPTFVTLVGDTTFDFRDVEGRYQGPKWRDFPQAMVPTAFPLSPSDSYLAASDNYFASVLEEEEYDDYPVPQLALTRISASSPDELEEAVRKLIAYPDLPGGVWQTNHVLLVDNTVDYKDEPPPDSQDEPIPFDDFAEDLVSTAAQAGMFSDKVYMTALGVARTHDNIFTPPEFNISKRRFATREHVTPTLWESLEQGELAVSFIGHGAWHTWVHELAEANRPPLYRDFEKWDCPVPPLLVQSSCSVADFDRTPGMGPDCVSEILLSHPRGCIAATGSTRTAGGNAQDCYHRTFFEAFYHPVNRLETPAFGLAHMQTLLITADRFLRCKQTMFGDSASLLRRAEYGLVLDPPAGPSVDRGEVLTVTGGTTLQSPGGPTCSGTVEIRAYDRPYMPYTYNHTRVYRLVGVASAELTEDGFSTQLALPLGIDDDLSDYEFKPSGYNLELRATLVDEVTGETITVAPFSGDDVWSAVIDGAVDPPADNEGPVVDLYFDDGAVTSGDYIDGNVKLTAELTDPHGILIARSDGDVPMSYGEIDRPIILVAEADDHSLDIDLTDLYKPVPGDHTRGVVEKQLELPAGDYTLTLYCYDNFGEPGSASAELVVADGLNISEVLVVPNPAPGPTAFTFFSGTRPDQARVRVYTPVGRLVRTIETNDLTTGFNVIEWDGTDGGGRPLANGVYLYSLEARAGDDLTTVFEKFIMLR
jgi:hypothetical protein